MATSGVPTHLARLEETFSEFTGFPKLPVELRLQIWNLSMLPRTVCIQVHDIVIPGPSEEPLVDLHSATPVPIGLQICRESRREALRTYKLCFGTELLEIREPGNIVALFRSPRTYFSYEMDTADFICSGRGLRRELPVAHMTRTDLDNVRHIRSDWCAKASEDLISQIAQFKKLESFALSWYWQDDMRDFGADEPLRAEMDVTEATYQQLRHNRPDVYQFMDAFITARDVFAPGYKIPLLRITSLNNDQMCEQILSLCFGGASAKWGLSGGGKRKKANPS